MAEDRDGQVPQNRGPMPKTPSQGPQDGGGLAIGSTILTQDGAMPVEFLSPGDRVVTRNGLRRLHSVESRCLTGQMYRLRRDVLGNDRPESDALLAPGTGLLIRDWRAKALYGQANAVIPVERLADGQYIAAVSVTQMHIFRLQFDAPEIIYAEGLELACAPAFVSS